MSRIDKINNELRQLISVMIQRELDDPSIRFVTITSVSTTADLKHAAVYFTYIGDDAEKERLQNVLNKASGYIKKLLGKQLYIKFIPDIKFIYDDTEQQKARIDKLLDQMQEDEKGDGK